MTRENSNQIKQMYSSFLVDVELNSIEWAWERERCVRVESFLFFIMTNWMDTKESHLFDG